jgi:hypothetical protein
LKLEHEKLNIGYNYFHSLVWLHFPNILNIPIVTRHFVNMFDLLRIHLFWKSLSFFCCPYCLSFVFPMFFLTPFKLDCQVPLIKLPLYSNQSFPKCQNLKKKSNKLTSYRRMFSNMCWTLKQWCARQHFLEIYFWLKFGYKIFEPNFTLSLMGAFCFEAI